eukprot:CAMPEP_0113492830 /NCGR_PEP_ID=MMETSP0014_2-20120614/28280_1 /TAXON_ID=2857 /ORGANISM="Nitzschia sp." /LENGTH=231 /DNA_ID=CAMNT_0000386677 /DNA_START=112 /DNA_END=807 /DNA_ORIENTATION=- /assembly_acc=CAM_ASM_000159
MAAEKSSVSFSVDNSQHENRTRSSMMKKRNSLRSSFFRMRSMSFRRSGGDRGADINTLRGTNGPGFEGYAVVNRSNEVVLCGCFGGGSGGDNAEKIVLIKGPFCFVFNKESDPSPKYAIGAAHMKAVSRQESHGHYIVTIETNLGDVEYELKFDKENIAKQFVESFQQQAAIGESDEVRKRLGHEQLLNKRSSVKYAETVANKKMEEQPEKKENLTADDLGRVMDRVQPGL